MSRTDHHAPAWVKALRAAEDGQPTGERHHHACPNYTGTWRPTHVIDWVRHDVADANGWEFSRLFHTTATHGVYRVPVVERPCDIDTATGKCVRWVENVPTRWYGGIRVRRVEINRDYFRPERASVRDSLRDAAKTYRGTGDVEDIDPPDRQSRNSRWNGGYWD